MFKETVRDIHAEPQWPGMVALATLFDRVSAHKALHRFTTYRNETLTVSSSGVLGNDYDPDGAPLSAVPYTQPSYGSLSLNADGSFTYTPNTDFVGNDYIEYQAYDGEWLSNVATVSISVYEGGGGDDGGDDGGGGCTGAPVANDDSYGTSPGVGIELGIVNT